MARRSLGPLPEPVAWIFLFLFVTGVIFMTRRNWPVAAFAALWLALPVALPIFLGDPRALQFRYAFVLPIYLTAIAYAVWEIAAWGTVYHSTSQYLVWILATISLIAALGIYGQPKPDWRSAAAYLNQHTGPADIILIGEIRTRETMEYAITFANTGHLVLATLHANNANQALDRVISFFPDEVRDSYSWTCPST